MAFKRERKKRHAHTRKLSSLLIKLMFLFLLCQHTSHISREMYDAFWINTPLPSLSLLGHLPDKAVVVVYCPAQTKENNRKHQHLQMKRPSARRKLLCVLRPERDAPEHAQRSRSVRDAPRNNKRCKFTHSSTGIHHTENIYKASLSSPQPRLFKTVIYCMQLSMERARNERGTWCVCVFSEPSRSGERVQLYIHMGAATRFHNLYEWASSTNHRLHSGFWFNSKDLSANQESLKIKVPS